jgi:membrane protein involved in colicin uptake
MADNKTPKTPEIKNPRAEETKTPPAAHQPPPPSAKTQDELDTEARELRRKKLEEAKKVLEEAALEDQLEAEAKKKGELNKLVARVSETATAYATAPNDETRRAAQQAADDLMTATRPADMPGVAGGRPKAPTDKNARIKILTKDNPKRGASRIRYNHYRDGMTVADYVERAGSKGMADIRWDLEHGFIQLLPARAAEPANS